MWDTAIDSPVGHAAGNSANNAAGNAVGPSAAAYLSHDLPCLCCGHAPHRYLSCSETCDCVPPPVPGSVARVA